MNPLLAENKANCETTKLIGGDENYPKHWNETWVKTLATDPDLVAKSSTAYPACALTFAVAQHHYKNKNLYLGTATAEDKARYCSLTTSST